MKQMMLLFSMFILFTSQAWSQDRILLNEEDLINNLELQAQENQALSPAKPITSVRVVRVASSTYPSGEDIAKGQTGTIHHHDGQTILVYTFEEGEGQEPYAWIHKTDIPAKYLLTTIAICQQADGQLDRCTQGGEFIGRLRTWDISVFGNGLFEYQIRSTSSGNKPYTARLNIH